MTKDWIIQDEFGNHCFSQKSFEDFEDGWEFLYETFPVIYKEDGTQDDQEEELLSYYVVLNNINK
tara:strand:- start:233 stop:427 length:195 start_codon:yes stop_codon:yes gene_type:complete